jgi:hypothetical protein
MTLSTYAHVIDELLGTRDYPLSRRSRGRGAMSLSGGHRQLLREALG